MFKALIVAFSMYSKIPMPRFEWESKDMEYHLVFFPWVGAVIGIIEYLWALVYFSARLNSIFYLAIALAIPLLITGGFHLDGFMDTMDALHSYQNREKKLEILKDPHIGAFSVICLVIFFLLAFGFSAHLEEYFVCGRDFLKYVGTMGGVFFVSRCLSGISVTFFDKAKKDGMVYTESKTGNKSVVGTVLIVELIIVCGLMIFLNFCWGTLGALAGLGGSFLYYYVMSKKEFGGITGDLAGFFVCVGELSALVVMVLAIMIWGF